MKTIKYPNNEQWNEILTRPTFDVEFLNSSVRNILNRVRSGGDKAIFQFNEKYDNALLEDLTVSEKEIKQSSVKISDDLKEAIQTAADNIEKFHSSQNRNEPIVETMTGVTCWRKSVPIEKVGIYIPGGTAPLFSTVLMLGIPAKLAGCREIILCSPPSKGGSIDPTILYTAELVGITKIFKVGGAQAIAAMAYGTESIPKVDKIFGPGNQYVTTAKQLISAEGIAIDMPAGPSEVAIIADDSANPEFVASDLLSQAEHGRDSQVLLITTSETLVTKVNEAIGTQIQVLPRKDIAQDCLNSSKAIVVKDIGEAIDLSNTYAPEHLIINTKNAENAAEGVTNAGSVFMGQFTPESAGDYASGTNHTLPTNGAARAYSGVSLDSFVKQITFQRINEEGLKNLGPSVEKMAEAEQLFAHKNAISLRLAQLQ